MQNCDAPGASAPGASEGSNLTEPLAPSAMMDLEGASDEDNDDTDVRLIGEVHEASSAPNVETATVLATAGNEPAAAEEEEDHSDDAAGAEAEDGAFEPLSSGVDAEPPRAPSEQAMEAPVASGVKREREESGDDCDEGVTRPHSPSEERYGFLRPS